MKKVIAIVVALCITSLPLLSAGKTKMTTSDLFSKLPATLAVVDKQTGKIITVGKNTLKFISMSEGDGQTKFSAYNMNNDGRQFIFIKYSGLYSDKQLYIEKNITQISIDEFREGVEVFDFIDKIKTFLFHKNWDAMSSLFEFPMTGSSDAVYYKDKEDFVKNHQSSFFSNKECDGILTNGISITYVSPQLIRNKRESGYFQLEIGGSIFVIGRDKDGTPILRNYM